MHFSISAVLLLGTVIANATAWYCPSHPRVNGTAIYKPACCDQVGVCVEGKFNGTNCYDAFEDTPTTETHGKGKKDYTCTFEGTDFGTEGCCEDVGNNEAKCVEVVESLG